MAFRSSIIPFSKACWDLELQGGGNLPPGPCFIYGNHSNNYDPFILNAFTELGGVTTGVMTMEYLRSGFLSKVFSAAGIVGTRKRVPEPHLIRRIWRMLEEGRRVVIFPEGGRRWDGRPAPWIESTAKLFMRASVPVYPVEIIGSYVGWPRWASWPRPAHLKVRVHDAVDFSDEPDLDTALNRLKKPIAVDENVVSKSIRPAWAFRPADGIARLLYRDPESGVFGGLRTSSGNEISNLSGTRRWSVQADSTLVDIDTGVHTTSADLYDQIKNLPLPDSSDQPILRGTANLRIESHLGEVRILPDQTCTLWKDHLVFGDTYHVDLEDVRYTGLERNDKFWLISDSSTVFAHFRREDSVLAWKDILDRLAPHINK